MTYTGATIPQQQSPFQNRLRGSYGGFFSFNGHIDTPANQDYTLVLFLPIKVFIQFVVVKTSAGTLTAAYKIGPTVASLTAITGLSAIAVTSTLAEVDFTATDGTNVGVVGQVIVLTVSTIAGAANFDWSLVYLRQ
jgi:hypothetical protein